MELWGLLLGFAALAALPAAAAAKGNFLGSCRDVTLGAASPLSSPAFNDIVNATCQTMENKSQITTMDLNLCVGFDVTAQALSWSPMGKFRNYCRDCSLQPPGDLQCTCGASNRKTRLDLNDGIANRNGTLACISWDTAQ